MRKWQDIKAATLFVALVGIWAGVAEPLWSTTRAVGGAVGAIGGVNDIVTPARRA